ncbi:MAG: hypothetical protein PHU23_14095 [Dehalococcoidales bacterium]|nr:hypothetical protein [Dehalococcoidales bacterium]
MFNKESMMNMVAKQFAEGLNQFPPEVQQALQNTEVFILKEDKQLRIVCRSLTGNEVEAQQVAQGLGNALVPLLARLIGGFKCQVRYQV